MVDSVPRIVLDLQLPVNTSVDLSSVLVNSNANCPISNHRIANVTVAKENLTANAYQQMFYLRFDGQLMIQTTNIEV